MSAPKRCYQFREITRPEALLEAFRLRYDEYQKTSLRELLSPTELGLDLNLFDLQSRHFGVYDDGDMLAGYFRLVLDRSRFFHHEVFELGSSLGVFHADDRLLDSPARSTLAAFPFLSREAVPQAVFDYVSQAPLREQGLAETGRLLVREDLRGLPLSTFLFDAGFAVLTTTFDAQVRHFVVACLRSHRRFYERLGYRVIDGGAGYIDRGADLQTMHLDASSSPLFDDRSPRYRDIAKKLTQDRFLERWL